MGGKRYSETEMEAAYAEGVADGMRLSAVACKTGAQMGHVNTRDAMHIALIIQDAIDCLPLTLKAIKADKDEDPVRWVTPLVTVK
jgi:hypothetical protein